MAVNADEGEPGTFKDRLLLESDPHRFLEGTLIGAHVVEAPEVYIYVRDEYPGARIILEREIARSPPGGPVLHLRRGAGAYICGEESSLLESIEGKRPLPRHKPPYPFQVGLFGRPTLINNVETLHFVRDILERGPNGGRGTAATAARGFATSRCPAACASPASSAPRPASPRGNSSRNTVAASPKDMSSRPTSLAAPRAGSCPRRWRTSRSISAR